MLRQKTVRLSLLFFNGSTAVLAGVDLYRFFRGAHPVVTVFSPKWILPIAAVTLLCVSLIMASWLAYSKVKRLVGLESWLENQRRKIGTGNWAIAFVILMLLSWGYLFSSFQAFLMITTRDSWIHLVVLIWAAQVIGICLAKDIKLFSDWRESFIGLILFLVLQLLGPFFIAYKAELILVVFCTSLFILALYRREAIARAIHKTITFVQMVARRPLVAEILTGIGFILYLWQAWSFSHTNASLLDEGAYLVKGLLFATGRYIPFQDFGPWTNKMPLSFLIPGYVQLLFGPGLRTARYFQVFLQLLMLIGIWIIAKRLGGRWGALAAVLLMAFNPVPIFIYSQAVSQGLVACLLVWSLVFTLGRDRPTWQLALGAFFAAITFLTRENLVPFLGLLILYILWQSGWKKSLPALFTAVLVIVVVNALFWPGILRIWAHWLPKSLTPFLDAWRYAGGGTFPWDMSANSSFSSSFTSFWDGVSGHFAAFVGGLGMVLFLPDRKHWKNPADFRTAVFLAVSFNLLMLAHAWASLANEYCVFCFVSYLAFFAPLGLFLLVLTFSQIKARNVLWRNLAMVGFMLVFMSGIGFGLRKNLTGLLNIKVLSIGASGQSVSLWSAVSAPLGIDYFTIQRLIPAVVIGGLAGFILFSVWLGKRLFLSLVWEKVNYWKIALPALLILVLVVTAAPVYQSYGQMCKMDEISAYEQAGSYLAETIPPGSQVYWSYELAVPLLYIQAKIYPPQLNDGFAFRRGSQTDLVARFGFWNDELARRWQQEADYVLMDDNGAKDPANQFLQEDYVEIGRTGILQACDDSAFIHVYKHK